ncbi:hypothetical protein, partial [Stenotrophomonas maltophilia]|uniref:hypothetical protein n=1 Tax=Stenotrophomonas maltophilia TaxID=40324 RepID=UPI0019531907
MIVAGILLVDAVWIAVSNFRFDTFSALKAVVLTSLCSVVAYIYHAKRPVRHLSVMCVETAILM